MDHVSLREAARAKLPESAWSFYAGVAGPAAEAERDRDAWQRIGLLPRTMTGLTGVCVGTRLDARAHRGGAGLDAPLMVAPTAAHQLAHPEAEMATERGAAAAGALMVYSSSATVAVTEFGAAATAPWWAQVYLMRDRGITLDYADRAAAAGAGALVLTVDYPGVLGSPAFRTATRDRMGVRPANYPQFSWSEMAAAMDPAIVPGDVAALAERTGLPVHVKGILRPLDARRAIDAGAAGLIVSNHGRRQVAGVVATADVLAGIVDAAGARVPVFVDGGIRDGADVLRALAMGASAAGLGRPVLWALAADGARGVADLLRGLADELRSSMASCGAGEIAALDRGFLWPPDR